MHMPWPIIRTIAAEALVVQRHQPPVDQEVRLIPSLVLDWVWRRGVEPLLVVCRLVPCKAVYTHVTGRLIRKLAYHMIADGCTATYPETQPVCSHLLDRTLQTAGRTAP